MITCKNCYFFDCCSSLNPEFKKYPKDFVDSDLCAKQCKTFKDIRLIIELPCRVGDTVFCDLDYLVHPNYNADKNYPLDEAIVTEISKGINDEEPLFTVMSYELAEYKKFWLSEFGKYVFTKEQHRKQNPTKLSVRRMKKEIKESKL